MLSKTFLPAQGAMPLTLVREELSEHLGRLVTMHREIMDALSGAMSVAEGERLRTMCSQYQEMAANLGNIGLRLAGLVELGMAVTAEQDPHRLLDTACRAARDILGSQYAVLGILHSDGSTLRHFVTRGLKPAQKAKIGCLVSEGILETLITARRPQRMCIAGGNPAELGFPPTHPPVNSFLGVPIAVRDRVLGWLYVADKQGGSEFSEDDERIATALAAQVAVAYAKIPVGEELRERTVRLELEAAERTRAEHAVAERLRLAELSGEVGVALNGRLDLRDMLQRCTEIIVEQLDATFARIWTFNSHDGMLELQASGGLYTHLNGPHSRIPLGEYKIGLIAQERKPHLTNSVIGDPRVSDQEWAKREGMVAFAGYPLIADGELVGVLAMFARHPLTDFTLNSLGAVADGIALGIRQKLAEKEIRRHVGRLGALREIDHAINSSLDLRITLDCVLDEAMKQLGIDAADILLATPGVRQLTYGGARGFNSREIEQICLSGGESCSRRVAVERRTLRIHDLRTETVFGSRLWMAKEDFVSYYGTPLIVKGEVRGVLEVYYRRLKQPPPDWFEFFEALAGQAAIAIDNAALFDHVQKSNIDLIAAYETTLNGWSAALDLRDNETEGHTQRVSELAVRLAREMGFNEEEIVQIRRGALLHDIGKMGIPDSILLKPGQLTESEWIVMKQHPVFAHDLLVRIEYLQPALDIPYCHHEKWDGTGYPRGLKGEEIPASARMFAAIDIWDALRTDRPYRAAWPEEKVRRHLVSLSGTHLEPKVVDAFLAMLEELNS